MKKITEGEASFYTEIQDIVSKEMEVFYNPVMKLNRDIALGVVKTMPDGIRVADPMAGTGIRTIRMLKAKKIEALINDGNPSAVKLIKKNLKLNKVNAQVSRNDANKFLLENASFDYIDIDPFGYPGPFMDCAVKKIRRRGILAVTATDTAALTGSSPKACKRKYFANPLKNENMHENSLRILIRYVQLIGSMNDKALMPILSYVDHHYVRAYFRVDFGKKRIDEIIKKHKMIGELGPIWTGALLDKKFARLVLKEMPEKEFVKKLIDEEIGTVGYYDLHKICSKLKRNVPPQEQIIEKIKAKGYRAKLTHFSPKGLKSDAPLKTIEGILKKLK